MKHAVKHIHLVGVGGAGMSGIAEILHNLGYTVSGSDQVDSATTRRLASLGIRVHIGHDAGHIAGAEAVVTSTAVRGDNPEVIAARARRVPVVPLSMLPEEPELMDPDAEPDALEPELIVPDAVEPAVEPCAAAPPPPGVPVVPMGVSCVLRWPAPTAGLVAGWGGVLCANAKPTVAAVATAARILSEDICGTPWMALDTFDRQESRPSKIRSGR